MIIRRLTQQVIILKLLEVIRFAVVSFAYLKVERILPSRLLFSRSSSKLSTHIYKVIIFVFTEAHPTTHGDFSTVIYSR